MAIIKISELPVATSPVSPSDVLPALQNGVTKKAAINQFGFLPDGTNATTTTIQNKLRETVSVKDFGAVGDGVANDTAAIQAAIDYASTAGKTVYFPAGTYIVVPATQQVWEGTPLGEGLMTCAFLMRSNMSLWGDIGAILKLKDNCSTLAAPVRLALFFTNVPVSNISFFGLTMDMNGLNNRISPNAPTSFNRFNQAMIHVTGTIAGVAARADDVSISHCKFLNTAGVTCIGMQQSNSAGVILSKNWYIGNCLFKNNGIDSDDHSSIFGWADNVVIENNTFTADSMFPNGITGQSGSFVAYEVHAANQRFVNNRVSNYWQGMWLASNLTSPADNIVIANNIFAPMGFYGIDSYRTGANESVIERVLIEGNIFVLDNTVYSPPIPTFKAAVQIAAFRQIKNVQISNNIIRKIGAGSQSLAVLIIPQGNAGNEHKNIVINNNFVENCTNGFVLNVNPINGMGPVEISNNYVLNCSNAPGATTPQGIAVSCVNLPSPAPYEELIISNNTFIDDRGANAEMDWGVRLAPFSPSQTLTINALDMQRQKYIGMVTGNYEEIYSSITKRLGYYSFISFTPVWKCNNVAITVGNGVVNASYTVDERQVTINAALKIGSTTNFGGGGEITFDLPFAADPNVLQYLGSWRIFDDSGGQFYFGGVVVLDTQTAASLQLNSGTYVTNTSPITLQTDDLLSVQITYTRSL